MGDREGAFRWLALALAEHDMQRAESPGSGPGLRSPFAGTRASRACCAASASAPRPREARDARRDEAERRTRVGPPPARVTLPIPRAAEPIIGAPDERATHDPRPSSPLSPLNMAPVRRGMRSCDRARHWSLPLHRSQSPFTPFSRGPLRPPEAAMSPRNVSMPLAVPLSVVTPALPPPWAGPTGAGPGGTARAGPRVDERRSLQRRRRRTPWVTADTARTLYNPLPPLENTLDAFRQGFRDGIRVVN